jgi:hypothetical protein
MAKGSITLARCLGEFLEALGDQARLAVVGGLAVSARTVPRFTADLDFAVVVADDAAAESLIFRLSTRGFRPQTILERIEGGVIGTARLRQSATSPIIDLLFAAAGIEAEVVEDAESLTVLGHGVQVARTGHLIAMKLVSCDDRRRPQDRVDLVQLTRVADEAEWARAEIAVRLIEERGFARGRDLRGALAEWRALAAER